MKGNTCQPVRVGRGDAQQSNGASLQSLETLRIIAAVLVVCAHIPAYDLPLIGQFLGSTRFLGSIGVDLFFCISGVVIGLSTVRSVTANADRPLANFLIARVFRIVPLYWVVTAITMVMLWRKGLPLPSAEELIHSLAFVPYLEGTAYIDPIVHIGWTLQFEVFFYALCAMGILCRSKWLPLAAALSLAAASLAFNHYYLNPILLEFALGYALALRLATLPPPNRAVPLLAICALASVCALFLYASTGRDGGYPPALDIMIAPRMMIAYGDTYLPRWFAWGLPSIALVAVALRLETSFRWRLAFLGKYTYSVYLCHTFAISISLSAARLLVGPDWAMVLLLPACIFVLAILTYTLIELPMIRVGKRITHRLRTHPVASDLPK